MSLQFEQWMQERLTVIENSLVESLPSSQVEPTTLHEAMRYAVLNGGKRIRPLLVFAIADALGDSSRLNYESIESAAVAVELIHCYSLVHDDLPCMDDDKLRRGKPTVHVQYDEATALLVGDSLQALAFDVLSRAPVAPQLVVNACQVLSVASSSAGMAGGQAIDLASTGHLLTLKELERMHKLKTGALLRAAVALGGIFAELPSNQRKIIDVYAQSLGLAFQVQDDILDVIADEQHLGKTVGKDAMAAKPTYVSLMGLEEAQRLAHRLHQLAISALEPLGESAQLLVDFANFLLKRNY